MNLRLITLGAPACFLDNRELVDLPAQRTRFALLVYLAMERNVARDETAALFWADSGDERARHALSQALYELKRVLGDGWIETQSGRLIASADVKVDAVEFQHRVQQEEHAEALQLYGGPFLSGFYLPNCKGFENWLERQRAVLERAQRRAQREVVSALIEGGRMADAVAAARHWVELDPFDDEANHRLIELLAITGGRTDALRAYAAYELRLKTELSVEPLDDTKAFVARLRKESRPGTLGEGIAVPLDADPGRHGSQAAVERSKGWRLPAYVATAVAVVAVILFASTARRDGNLDPTLFAVLPFTYGASVDAIDEGQLLEEALSRWDGVRVIDLFQIRDALARHGRPLRSRDALEMAQQLGAGRYIRGDVLRLGDSLRIRAVLYDATARGRPLAERIVRTPLSLAGADSAFAQLADALLFPGDPPAGAREAAAGTRSWPARRAFTAGLAAVQEWDLTHADSAFSVAVQHDPEFTAAFLWLAQVRAWTRTTDAEWQFAAEHAFADSSKLSLRDRQLAAALVAMADGDFPAACARYRQLTVTEPHAFVSWYGLADCLHRDNAVIRDVNSPTGFAFRTSFSEAMRAYTKAFNLMPSIHKALHGNSYQRLRSILITSDRFVRSGQGAGDTTTFRAYPYRSGDTLAFSPAPAADVMRPQPWLNQASRIDAVRQQRLIFHQIAAGWLAAFPESSEAVEAVAVALEMLGNPAAVDSLQRARAANPNAKARLRLAVNEVFVRMKFAIPLDEPGMRKARALADSILRSERPESTSQPRMLASLAALLGRADLAAQYNQHETNVAESGDPEIGRAALALQIYAALGGPVDSIRRLEQRLDAAIEHNVLAQEQPSKRSEVYLRVAPLTLPAHALRANDRLAAEEYPPLMMASAAAALDQERVLSIQRDLAGVRRNLIASSIALDALVPEAWSLYRVGEARRAIEWLEPTLTTLRFSPPALYSTDPILAASLGRAIALRAELAHATGNTRDRLHWSRAASVLWTGSDPFLAPAVKKLKLFAANSK